MFIHINKLWRGLRRRLLRQAASGCQLSGSRRVALTLEPLENRWAPSVASLFFSGDTLVVKTDNVGTVVTVNDTGADIVIEDEGAGRSWSYDAGSVGSVEFQGGAGNDHFKSLVPNLKITAFGAGGDDKLEGYDAADTLVGGPGDDILVGFGGNDRLFGDAGEDRCDGMNGDDELWGGADDDQLRGGNGNDQILGEDGNDNLNGGEHNDTIWGGNDNDTLLGMAGNDQILGEAGNDHLNGGAGNDSLWGGAGRDELIAIDNGTGDFLEGEGHEDAFWVDKNAKLSDRVADAIGEDKVHYVAKFANGADRTLNHDRIADPKTKVGLTYRRFDNVPLFTSAGPDYTDPVQGDLGDCWLLAGLGAIALSSPTVLRQNIVDFGDGTYGVRLGSKFYRVDNDLPVKGSSTELPYAALHKDGSKWKDGSMWVAIVEKAFTHYQGKNSYKSLNGGPMSQVNKAFGSTSAGQTTSSSYANATAFANDLYWRWNNNHAVTIGTDKLTKKKVSASDELLIRWHAYIVVDVTRNAGGVVTTIQLRNPWGEDGKGNDGKPADGLVTVTPSQLMQFHNFVVSSGQV